MKAGDLVWWIGSLNGIQQKPVLGLLLETHEVQAPGWRPLMTATVLFKKGRIKEVMAASLAQVDENNLKRKNKK